MLQTMAMLWHGCPGGWFSSRKALGPGFGDTYGQNLDMSGLWFCWASWYRRMSKAGREVREWARVWLDDGSWDLNRQDEERGKGCCPIQDESFSAHLKLKDRCGDGPRVGE